MLAISLTIACSRYTYDGVILHAHPVRGESHIQRNTTGEVATVPLQDLESTLRAKALGSETVIQINQYETKLETNCAVNRRWFIPPSRPPGIGGHTLPHSVKPGRKDDNTFAVWAADQPCSGYAQIVALAYNTWRLLQNGEDFIVNRL